MAPSKTNTPPSKNAVAATKNSNKRKKKKQKSEEVSDLPVRARSAYNFFYQYQRLYILKSLNDPNDPATTNESIAQELKEREESVANENSSSRCTKEVKKPQNPEEKKAVKDYLTAQMKELIGDKQVTRKKRVHRKTPGMIELKDLTCLVAFRWKRACEATREFFDSEALKDLVRYNKEMEAYRLKKSDQKSVYYDVHQTSSASSNKDKHNVAVGKSAAAASEKIMNAYVTYPIHMKHTATGNGHVHAQTPTTVSSVAGIPNYGILTPTMSIPHAPAGVSIVFPHHVANIHGFPIQVQQPQVHPSSQHQHQTLGEKTKDLINKINAIGHQHLSTRVLNGEDIAPSMSTSLTTTSHYGNTSKSRQDMDGSVISSHNEYSALPHHNGPLIDGKGEEDNTNNLSNNTVNKIGVKGIKKRMLKRKNIDGDCDVDDDTDTDATTASNLSEGDEQEGVTTTSGMRNSDSQAVEGLTIKRYKLDEKRATFHHSALRYSNRMNMPSWYRKEWNQGDVLGSL